MGDGCLDAEPLPDVTLRETGSPWRALSGRSPWEPLPAMSHRRGQSPTSPARTGLHPLATVFHHQEGCAEVSVRV